MQDPHEGLRIGRYTLVRKLGAGGMGSVWEAVLHGPEGFQKPVALKLLLPAGREGAETDRRSLVREARIGALLHHPNVVGTHDLGEVDGRWYVAMELVRGSSLADALDTGPLPALAVVEAAQQVCAGLAHIHGLEVDGAPAGLVHRDLKPSNLLLDRSGLVKIADLGIARLQAGPGGASGTAGYLSEEQSLGREDQRSDLFSLGVTLFQLATGDLPFGVGVPALYKLTQVEELLAKGLCRPVEDAIPGLGAVVHRCLRRDPDDRFPDAHTLGEALARVRADLADGLSLGSVLARTRPDLAPETSSSPRRAAPIEQRTQALAPGNLPPQTDPFFGRRAELHALGDRVRAHERLLVLKGPGGTGKTRLALAVAREVATDLRGGSWFLDLSEATTVAGVCSAVAAALQVGLDRQDPVRQLGRAFAYRGRALFVLDNLEQVVDAVPETLSRWLELAPEATFLCTSRVSLRVSGERVIPVDPLPVDAGVDLFLERSPRPPGPSERAAVAKLVEELEGLPLAIELAAARTRLMPVKRIRERLSDRLKLLADGDRDRPTRQRSLTASLDASWDLLPPWGRDALVQLAAFDGGCTLDAAEVVVDVSRHPDAPWGVDVLAELVDASLLRTEPSGDRFRMLVVVHEWARSRAEPELLAAAERRHGAWCARHGTEEAITTLYRHGGLERQLELLPELDNLVAACRRAIARGDGATAALTCAAAGDLLVVRGPLSTLVELTTAVLALSEVPLPSRRRLYALLATAHMNAGRIDDAGRAQEQALALAIAEGNALSTTNLQARIGWRLQLEGKPEEALAACARALVIAATNPRPEVRLAALRETGGVHWLAGRLVQAQEAFEEAIPLARRIGDFRSEAFCTGNLGLVLSYLGDRASALPHLRRAHDALAVLGDRRNQALLRVNMGLVQQESGHLVEAREQYARAVEMLGEVGDERGRATALCNLGYALHELGESAAGRPVLEESLAIAQRVSDANTELLVMSNLGVVAWDLGHAAAAERWWSDAAERSVATGQHRTHMILSVQLAYFALDRRDCALARSWLATAAEAAALASSDRRVWIEGALGRVLLEEGDLAGGIRALEAAVDDLRATGDLLRLSLQVHLASAVARAGDLDRALALADEVEALLAAGGYCGALAEARAHRGAIHARRGETLLAEADFASATALLDRAGFLTEAPLRRELRALSAATSQRSDRPINRSSR